MRRADSDARDYVDHFRDLLRTAVADRLPAGKVAISMSGGLDSTAIAGGHGTADWARTRPPRLYRPFHRLIPDEERHFSGLAAAALGIPIYYLAADDYRPFQDVATGSRHFPEPVDDPFSAISMDAWLYGQSHSRRAERRWRRSALLYSSPAYLMNLLCRGCWGALVAKYCK